MYKYIRYGLAISCLVFPLLTQAYGIAPTPVTVLEAEKSPDNFEVIGALGIAALAADTADNSELGVTSSETDRLVQTSSNSGWNSLATQFGVGYVHYFGDAQQYSRGVQWFPTIEPEVNFYYISNTDLAKGDVWRFDSPDFNQLTYKISASSARVMLDAALTVFSWRHFSVYAKGGIGNAWNDIDYIDKDNDSDDGCPNQRLDLSSTDSGFAWELGGGINFAFNKRIGLSLEYLYTDLGKSGFPAKGDTGTITAPVIVAPGNFKLKAQSALLGLHIAL